MNISIIIISFVAALAGILSLSSGSHQCQPTGAASFFPTSHNIPLCIFSFECRELSCYSGFLPISYQFSSNICRQRRIIVIMLINRCQSTTYDGIHIYINGFHCILHHFSELAAGRGPVFLSQFSPFSPGPVPLHFGPLSAYAPSGGSSVY